MFFFFTAVGLTDLIGSSETQRGLYCAAVSSKKRNIDCIGLRCSVKCLICDVTSTSWLPPVRFALLSTMWLFKGSFMWHSLNTSARLTGCLKRGNWSQIKASGASQPVSNGGHRAIAASAVGEGWHRRSVAGKFSNKSRKLRKAK